MPELQQTCITQNQFVTIMVGLTPDEADVIRRLREMQRRRHQLVIIQFTQKGMRCREVGKLEDG
jgi:hypothetical protein